VGWGTRRGIEEEEGRTGGGQAAAHRSATYERLDESMEVWA